MQNFDCIPTWCWCSVLSKGTSRSQGWRGRIPYYSTGYELVATPWGCNCRARKALFFRWRQFMWSAFWGTGVGRKECCLWSLHGECRLAITWAGAPCGKWYMQCSAPMPMDRASPQILWQVRGYHPHGPRRILARSITNAWPDQSLPA